MNFRILPMLLSAIVMQFLGAHYAISSPSKPTLEFARCERMVGYDGPEADKIQPNDFIAICAGGGEPETKIFKTTWRNHVETCRAGHHPDVSLPYYARGFYYHKGETVTTNIDCEKVFEIAMNFGLISSKEAQLNLLEWRDSKKKSQELLELMRENERNDDWRARFLLSVVYLGLEPSAFSDNKFNEGLDLVRKQVRSGHAQPLMEYLLKIDARNQTEKDLGAYDRTYMALHYTLNEMSKQGYAPAAMKQCEREVNLAIKIFLSRDYSISKPATTRSYEENGERDAVRRVRDVCGAASKLVDEKEQNLLEKFVSEVEALQRDNDRKKALAQRQRDEALYAVLALVGAVILSAADTPANDRDVAAERRESNRQQCLQMQTMALASGDLTMMGAAHIVPCM